MIKFILAFLIFFPSLNAAVKFKNIDAEKSYRRYTKSAIKLERAYKHRLKQVLMKTSDEVERKEIENEIRRIELFAIGRHKVIGTWVYKAHQATWSREFTKDGLCILRRENVIYWKSPWQIINKNAVLVVHKNTKVEDGEKHIIMKDSRLELNGGAMADKKEE